MARLRWRLPKSLALAAVSSFFALGSIQPSFYLNACSWNATDIVVLAPTSQPGTFRVLETIKGELTPGASLELHSLTPSLKGAARLSDLSKGDFPHPFVGIPSVGESDRLIVFLRRPGSLPEYNPRPDLFFRTSDWEPANLMGDLRTSAVWIQHGRTYGFLQTNNPGPSRLARLGASERELRTSIQSVLLLRGAMDRAMADPDPAERSRQLAALVRSKNEIARMSAVEKLKHGGAAEANVLLELLSDKSLLGWHQDFIEALVGMHATGVPFAQLLGEETTYWSKVCRIFTPGWWNDMQHPDVETAKNHYTRTFALLKGIHTLDPPGARPFVQDFAAVWSTCPPLEEREKTNQIAEELKLLLGH